MKKLSTSFSFFLSSALVVTLFSVVTSNAVAQSSAEEKVINQKQEVSQQLNALFPRIGEVEVEESPVAGVFQFWIGADLNHVSLLDGHLMLGEVFDTKRSVSLAREAKSGKVQEIIEEVDQADMIIFAAENEQRIVNVFTDVDCGFCRKLHREVEDLNDAGITVRYIAFPAYSRDLAKHVSVWCADDPIKAMSAAKQGGTVPEKVCENSVEETLRLGVSLGFRGTPQIVYDSGQIIGGYRESSKIIEDLGLGG